MAVRVDPRDNERGAFATLGVTFDRARVLEIGCGDGRLTRMYAAQARSVVAIDPDPNAIAEARADAPWPAHVEFAEGGIADYQPTREPFDIVLFAWSL